MAEAMETGPVVQVEEIGQVALTVTDLARAKRFYGDVLGMAFLFDAGTMAFFQCGRVRVMLGTGGEVNASTLVYLRVADIGKASEALKGAGVEFVREPHLVAKLAEGEVWMAAFHDSEGNVLHLMN